MHNWLQHKYKVKQRNVKVKHIPGLQPCILAAGISMRSMTCVSQASFTLLIPFHCYIAQLYLHLMLSLKYNPVSWPEHMFLWQVGKKEVPTWIEIQHTRDTQTQTVLFLCYGWPVTPGENVSKGRRGDKEVKPEKRNRRVMREATRQDRVVLLQLAR